MKERLISKRYATAFLKNLDSSKYDVLLSDVKIIRNTIQSNENIFDFMKSALITRDQKLEIGKILSENLTLEYWNKFYEVLINKHRFGTLSSILDILEKEVYDAKEMVKVHLKFARELSDEAVEKVKAFLKDFLKKDLILEIEYDKSIVGGFVATSNSLLIDASVKTNLEKFVRSVAKKF